MLRENAFRIGGGVMIGLGAALALGLIGAGAGWFEFESFLACGLSVVFGLFFLYVGREESRDRREELRRIEREAVRPPDQL